MEVIILKFITVIDVPKIDEIIDTGCLSNNYVFDIEDGAKGIISGALKELNLDSDSIVNGYCIDESYGDLSKLWFNYLKQLPVKTGDVIVQFGVSGDECLFCDFNDFMEFNYCDDYERIGDIISYRFDKDKIAFTQQLDLALFEKAFIVSDEWSKDDLVESSLNSSSNVITDINNLKAIGDSSVWRK